MEYLTGGQVNDLEYLRTNKIDPYDVANKIGQLYSNMIFINGFVHSDPHPGNILVHKSTTGDNEVILLDHGLYAVSLTTRLSIIINFEFRSNYFFQWLYVCLQISSQLEFNR